MSEAADIARARAGSEPCRLGIVLGSGLGGLAERLEEPVSVPYRDLPTFPQPGVTAHAGALVIGRLAGLRVALLAGRSHYYERGDAGAMKAPLACLKALGCEALFLSNAAGSLRPEVGPGSLAAISDHINLSGANPLIGEEGDARFVDMAGAYDPDLRARLKEAAAAEGIALSEGVYAWFSGPSFETPAEIRMAQSLGADLVGMSTVPETILARFLGLKVLAVSAVTNLGAGLGREALSHEQTKRVATRLSGDFERLVKAFCADFAASGT
jgi:purine-nucleoside phosphorylase